MDGVEYVVKLFQKIAGNISNYDKVGMMISYYAAGALYSFLSLALFIFLLSNLYIAVASLVLYLAIAFIANIVIIALYFIISYRITENAIKGKLESFKELFKVMREKYLEILKAIVVYGLLFIPIIAVAYFIYGFLYLLAGSTVSLLMAVILISIPAFAIQVAIAKVYLKKSKVIDGLKEAFGFFKKVPLIVFVFHLAISFIAYIIVSVIEGFLLSFNAGIMIAVYPLFSIFVSIISSAIPIKLVMDKKV